MAPCNQPTKPRLMGDGVNVAARLASIRELGAICLLEDSRRQVKSWLDPPVADLRNKELKNIAERVRVFRYCQDLRTVRIHYRAADSQ
jgi:adenylate cyclase